MTDTLTTDEESRAAYEAETRAKYKQSEIDTMGGKGQAFGPDADGHYSYPIGDAEDLGKAIQAVGRGNADHDAIRKFIIGRAKALGLSKEIPDNWGADGSLEEAAADELDHRDQALERRKRIAEQLLKSNGGQERRAGSIEVRADSPDDGMLHISGYATVYGKPYDMGSYDEIVQRGALKNSLNRGAQVHLLGNHDGYPLASTVNNTLTLTEDEHGLRYDAAMDPEDTDSQLVYRKVKSGLLKECSFAFRTVRQAWNDDYTERTLTELSIDRGDVSVVNWGASPHTAVAARSLDRLERLVVRHALDMIEAGVDIDRAKDLLSAIAPEEERADTKQCPTCDGDGTIRDGNMECPTCDGSGEVPSDYEAESLTLPELRTVVVALMENRVGATHSAATLSGLQEVLDLIDASDTNVDQALIKLSALMGVTNPDIAQDAALDRGCGCCADCSDDCDGSCCDACDMGTQSNGFVSQFFQTNARARLDLEAARYGPVTVTP